MIRRRGLFTALAVNLKRLVELACGVPFRYQPPPGAYRRQATMA